MLIWGANIAQKVIEYCNYVHTAVSLKHNIIIFHNDIRNVYRINNVIEFDNAHTVLSVVLSELFYLVASIVANV